MKRLFFFFASLMLVSLAGAQSTSVEAARGVLERTIGGRAKDFAFRPIPAADGLDVFEVEAEDGLVTVRGSSATAMTRGAYEYLKNACRAQVSWSGANVKLPKHLPNYPKRRVVTPNVYRHYYNVCTFGYTTVWWDWKRWEREIDWMALHGINMPLAMTGQEAIWQRVFRSFGVPDESIAKHFTGPAFLPWHRMGNVNSHMGPLPQSWIDGQVALQKQILARQRELGMTPVVPGFSGFVPVDFDKYVAGVQLASPTAWAGFEPTKFVDVRSPMFVEIGKRFVTEYRKEFGTDHLYLCDTFNEQNPQFPEATKLQDLAASGRAVYESIRQADPEGVWVMQGWLFYNSRDYWGQKEVEALMSEVPEGKMIILDLATSEFPGWLRQPAVAKNGWIMNTLHNYGQNTALYGDLDRYMAAAMEPLKSPLKGRMLGMGLTMEGIDQNPIIYELMTDLMWRDQPVDTREWTWGYATSRYGKDIPEATRAWELVRSALYGHDYPWSRTAWRMRPSVGRMGQPYADAENLERATRLLLSAAPQLKDNELYQRDLVDITKTWLSTLTDVHLAAAVFSLPDKPSDYRKYRGQFFAFLNDLDRLMACRPEHRLSTWIRDARKWGASGAEKDHMERNARMQITVWGGPYLADYANKEWAGLIQDFFVPRWQMFFGALEKSNGIDGMQNPDFGAWETKWAMSTGRMRESAPGDPVKVAGELLAKYEHVPTTINELVGLQQDPGIAVGKPTRDSGGTEGNNTGRWAVDGQSVGAYWAASPSPQWLEIDLEKVERINVVHVFPYFADDRYYQYKVEVSTDGQSWTTVADASSNTTRANLRGHRHEFGAVEARYVRVTMLKNSANVGVHLHEVRVYRAG